MKTYLLELDFIKIPSYGVMILTGAVVANIIVFLLITIRDHKDIWEFIVLEGFGLLGAVVGSKLLYIIVSFDDIPWERAGEAEFWAILMGGGFVFYGGLILAIVLVLIGAKVNKIDALDYINNYAFAIPLAHGFGRIGCFLAGCCYGVPYDGPLAVIYPDGSLIAPSGIPMFPVQLVESACLFVIAAILFLFYWFGKSNYLLPTYLILYSIVRFVLEFYRWDEYRGKWLSLYTSQWISLIMILVSIIWIIIQYRRQRQKDNAKKTTSRGQLQELTPEDNLD